MRGQAGCLAIPGGCLTKLALMLLVGAAFTWGVIVVLNPWALHIGGRSTPLLYWHGTGAVRSTDGRTHPLYVSFWPGRPRGFSGGGRREGKRVTAAISGDGWLCIAPGTVERLEVSGTMYGGYTDTADGLMDFRLLERRKPVAIGYQHRGFFDLAGVWRGADLVMDRPNEQGIPFKSGLFIDHATTTLRWASYAEFEAACRPSRDTARQ